MSDRNKNRRTPKPQNRRNALQQKKLSTQKSLTAASNDVAMAKVAWDRGRHQEAIEWYEKAIKHAPNNGLLIVNTAWCYGLRFRYEKAYQLIARANELGRDDIDLQRRIGELYVHLKDFPAAELCYRHILSCRLDLKQRVRTLVALGRILERLHRVEPATECVKSALLDYPDHPNANFLLAKLQRRSGASDSALAIFEQLATNSKIAPDVRSNAWYEIASYYDRSGHYDRAYEALKNSKLALLGLTEKHWRIANTVAANNERMLTDIRAAQFTRWREQARDLSPQPARLAWLVGHPRSGTTLLEQVLDSHPDLKSADELDVLANCVYPELGTRIGNQFSMTEMLNQASAEQINLARTDYWQRIESALRIPIGNRVLLDKNPELTLLLPVIGRIFPESKVIVAVRDPRDVVMSCFAQALPLNGVSVNYLTIENTARKYATMMGGWLKLREWIPNDWLEIKYEDTVDDLETQARLALAFIGLEWDSSVLNYRDQALAKHIHSPTYEAVTQPIYRSSVGRWRHYEKQLAPVLDILEPFVQAFGYQR